MSNIKLTSQDNMAHIPFILNNSHKICTQITSGASIPKIGVEQQHNACPRPVFEVAANVTHTQPYGKPCKACSYFAKQVCKDPWDNKYNRLPTESSPASISIQKIFRATSLSTYKNDELRWFSSLPERLTSWPIFPFRATSANISNEAASFSKWKKKLNWSKAHTQLETIVGAFCKTLLLYVCHEVCVCV